MMQFKFIPKFFSLLLALIGSFALDAQVINTESFDNTTFLPSAWLPAGANNLWSRRTTGTFPTCNPQSGAGMARFGARGTAANTAQTFSTPPIDYSNRGSSQAYISFWIYRDNGSVNGDSLSFYINTSVSLVGATHLGTVARYTRLSIPDTVTGNAWCKYTFNVPSNFTSNTNYILLKGISQNGNNIYIDGIEWNSFPTPCSGQPAAGSATASPNVVCGGSGTSALTLSGYTADVTGLTFQWKVASSINGPYTNVGGNSATLLTGFISATQYYKCVVTCTNSGLSDSCSAVSVVVKQNGFPQITVSPNSVNYCLGKPVKVFASGASTYVWSPATGLNTTNSDTIYASPNATSNYIVRGTDTAGCVGQGSVTVTLRQNPFVIINSGDTNLCVGDSVLLTAQSGGGGNTFIWLPNGKTTASFYAKPTSTNLYSVTVTNTFGCKGNAKKNVLVAQKPNADFNVTIFARTYRFSNNSSNGKSVLWDFGDGNFSSAQNPNYTYSEDGIKTITLIVSNPPCLSDTFSRTFNVSSIGKTSAQEYFTISPNPAHRSVRVYLKQATNEVQLLDVTGQLLLSENTTDNLYVDFDLSHFSRGIYFIKTTLGIQKLILE